jgi:hypothetical protein
MPWPIPVRARLATKPPMARGVKEEMKVEMMIKSAPMFIVHFRPNLSEMGADKKKPVTDPS